MMNQNLKYKNPKNQSKIKPETPKARRADMIIEKRNVKIAAGG
jgi:hypothetical protein